MTNFNGLMNSRLLKCKAAHSNLPPQYFAHNQVYQQVNAHIIMTLAWQTIRHGSEGYEAAVCLYGGDWDLITLHVTGFKGSNQTACFIQISHWCVALHLICTDDGDNDFQDTRSTQMKPLSRQHWLKLVYRSWYCRWFLLNKFNMCSLLLFLSARVSS